MKELTHFTSKRTPEEQLAKGRTRMQAQSEILNVYNRFHDFGMETFTKAWLYHHGGTPKQRSVEQMQEHRALYGSSGNCFDLAYWLLSEFQREGIRAYPIGRDLKTPHAHVAVIAEDGDGYRYLCDLGDQWLQPILLDSRAPHYTPEALSGFFPAATVAVTSDDDTFTLTFTRCTGKQSVWSYSFTPLDLTVLREAGEYSQNFIKKPLFEKRIPDPRLPETAHWEFYDWKSFISTSHGLYDEEPLATNEEWAERIHKITGMSAAFALDVLNLYTENKL
jgi:hypothetical protein